MNCKTIRNGALFSLFSFINKGFSFLLLMVMANLMTPAEYGCLNLFNTIIMVVGVIIALSTEGYLSVAFFHEGNSGIKKTFSVIFCISVLMSCFLIGSILLSNGLMPSLLDLSNGMLILAVLICFFTVFNNIILDLFRIKEKVMVYGILSCCCALMNLGLSVFCIKELRMGWEGRVYAQFVCMLLFGCIGIFYFLHHKYFTFEKSLPFRSILVWSFPLIPHVAASFVRQGGDRYIINEFHSVSDVGIFSFALTLVNIITMVGFGFNQSNSVDIYKTLSDGNITNKEKEEKLAKQRKIFMGIYIIATLLSIIVVYFFIPVIMPEYTESVKYFFVLAIYGLGTCFYLLYTNYLFYFKKTKWIMYITMGTALVHLILSFFFTRYSLMYTAILYSMTQLIIVLLVRFFALKTLSMHIEK